MTSARTASIALLALLPILLLGFWRRYFAALDAARLGLHVHAAVMFLWIGVLVAQAWLAGSGRLTLHRAMGRTSIPLGVAVIGSGLVMAWDVVRAGPLSGADLQQLTLPLGGLGVFTVAFALALRHRRRRELHGRYMVVTGLGLTGAAVQRIFLFYVPGFADPVWAGHGYLLAMELLLVVLVAGDAGPASRPGGRVRAPYVVALGLFGLNHLAYWGVRY